jgi:protein O-GlcNAc transferase
VLGAVSGSRLLVVAPAGSSWERVERVFEARGISTSRLERLPHAARDQYLVNIQRMDCVLDCVPYNGGTASFDALGLGVPLITLAGKTASSRAGQSIAHHLGLPELVATTTDEYVSLAVALSADLPRLAKLRAGLPERLASSQLCNPVAFARDLERGYREMFDVWASSRADRA